MFVATNVFKGCKCRIFWNSQELWREEAPRREAGACPTGCLLGAMLDTVMLPIRGV